MFPKKNWSMIFVANTSILNFDELKFSFCFTSMVNRPTIDMFLELNFF